MLRTAVAIPSPLGLLGAVPISPNIRCGAVREGSLRLLRGGLFCASVKLRSLIPAALYAPCWAAYLVYSARWAEEGVRAEPYL